MSDLCAKIIDIGDESMLGLCEDGRKVWLEGPAVPGDRVHFVWEGESGRITGIPEPSPVRRPTACPHFENCPGCQLQPLPYERQLALKANKIEQTLKRLGGFDNLPFEGIQASPKELATRNKLDFTIEGNQLGYQGRNGMVPVEQCPVGDTQLNNIIPEFRQWLCEHPRNQLHRVLFRRDSRAHQVVLLLRGVLSDLELQDLQTWADTHPEIAGLAIQNDWQSPWEELSGSGKLTFHLAGETFHPAFDAFFQVNHDLAGQMVSETMAELGQGSGALLDLFCGVGVFTLPAARLGWKVLGVDSHPGKGPFKQADLRKGVPKKLLKQPWQVVITDPPRSGMEAKLCQQLREQVRPKTLIYISCNPATLARDLKRICENGDYQIKSVKGYDLFPQTTHVETRVVLERVV